MKRILLTLLIISSMGAYVQAQINLDPLKTKTTADIPKGKFECTTGGGIAMGTMTGTAGGPKWGVYDTKEECEKNCRGYSAAKCIGPGTKS